MEAKPHESGVRRRQQGFACQSGVVVIPKDIEEHFQIFTACMEKFCDDGSRRIAFSGDQSVIPRGSIAPDARHRKVELDPAAGNRCGTNKFSIQGYRRKGTDGFTQEASASSVVIIW